MTQHAWENYKQYAWGKNELKPLSNGSHNGSPFGAHELGLTIVDSLDTLYIMGLTKEYREGRDWVEEHFQFNVPVSRNKNEMFTEIVLIDSLLFRVQRFQYLKPTFDSLVVFWQCTR